MRTFIVVLVLVSILVITESKKTRGTCFTKYSKANGCRKVRQINGRNASTIEECCKGGGAGWSLKRRDRPTCTSCEKAASKDTKGVCFGKYSKKDGCRKFIEINGRKAITIEECCRGGGAGWSVRKGDRRTCTSCDKVDTSFWGKWGDWSTCSATCGQSIQNRQRKCISNRKPNCRGSGVESRRCKAVRPCPVDGGWSQWSAWGPCSVTCRKGTKIQKRACANPKPMYGGKECQGKYENWAECELQQHCPIDGGWGEWTAWGECSKTCDLGTKKRSRKCDTPKPQYGGMQCTISEAIGIDYCREERCRPGSTVCDERSEECVSGSGSGWETSSGSGSGESSGSGFGSGFGSGEGSGEGKKVRRSAKKRPNFPDDEDWPENRHLKKK